MVLLSTAANSDLSTMIVNIGIIILAGLFMGRLFEMVKVPAITGYIVAGLLLGPITHIISPEDLSHLSVISDIALGFIAFQVGTELWFGKLKKSGTKIVVITIVQAVLTTLVVAGLTSFFVDLPIALLLGAIAAATDPVPIMMLIKKHKTKGELTDTILPVVGLDDAVGVVLFGIILSISMTLMTTTSTGLNLIEMFKEPIMELLISAVLGLGFGAVSGLAARNIQHTPDKGEKYLNVIVITVFLTTGAALWLGASPILTPMIAGTVVTNLIDKSCYRIEEETIRFFVPPIMIAFFTIAGAELRFDVVITAGIVGLIYVIGRIIGKCFGAYAGSTMVKSGPTVKKYLGMSLLPQSGVAIGLSIAAYSAVSTIDMQAALVIKNVILASVLFFELTGPILVKISFIKSKEMTVHDACTKKVKTWKNSPVSQN